MANDNNIEYYSLSNELDLDEPHNIQPWKRLSFQCAKTFVFILNGFFWLLGWTLIGVGISLQSSVATHRYLSSKVYEGSAISGEDANGGYSSASELCLSIGCIIIVVVLLACCGTQTENHLILGIYLAVVVIFLSFEIGAITMISFHKEKVEQRIINDIKLTMDLYEVKNFEGITRSIDSFQKVFHCCGCIDYTDWFNTTWGKHHRMNVPASCFKNNTWQEAAQQEIISDRSTNVFAFNTKGCFKHVRNYFVKNLHLFRTLIACVLAIQITGLAFSVCLFYKYKYHKTRISSRNKNIKNAVTSNN
jgi:tetraspanin-9